MIDVVALTRELVRIDSVTPDDGRAIGHVKTVLEDLGFTCELLRFGDVPNLYARLGTAAPCFAFAGHTDVVPAGPDWQQPPFDAAIGDGIVTGRGTADMKGAIAAFCSALSLYLQSGTPRGSIALLLTGDEEGPGIDGTVKMMAELHKRGERFDMCLVGEPTSHTHVGDTIKNGRRGSLHGVVTVRGKQGHVAYPERAHNPLPGAAAAITRLSAPLDDGNAFFPPSNLEVLDVRVGNDADNVIPAQVRFRFNVRFNTERSVAELKRELEERAGHDIDWRLSGEAFVTEPGPYISLLQDAVQRVTGRTPELSTSGGTSDARFIQHYCPVAELGLCGATMHKANEAVAIADLEVLRDIYLRVLKLALGDL